jgi:catechol 2,3-dioxygenase-like lactoylglutathione lyase family enzyme
MIRSTTPTVFVSDLERAVRFYTQTLDLKLVYHVPGAWAQVADASGAQIGLHPPGKNTPQLGTSGSIQIGFSLDEPLDRVVETLKQHGVTFRGPVVDDTAVRLAFFTDPDGTELYLCEPKTSHAHES